jgi:hypothetical protein
MRVYVNMIVRQKGGWREKEGYCQLKNVQLRRVEFSSLLCPNLTGFFFPKGVRHQNVLTCEPIRKRMLADIFPQQAQPLQTVIDSDDGLQTLDSNTKLLQSITEPLILLGQIHVHAVSFG